MQILDGRLLLSATDLVNFLGCRHATYLDMRDLTDPVELPDATVLIFEKGIEHEKRYLASLKARDVSVVEVPGEGFDLPERTAQTRGDAGRRRGDLSSGSGRAALAWLRRLSGTGSRGVDPRFLELRSARHQTAP